MTYRRIFVLCAAVAFAALLFFAGYTKYHPSWGRYNLLVITVDTLRSDHLGCYGYDKIKTPWIDTLARQGTLFKTAVSQAPLTLPSHAALFASTYPPFNGVRDNGGNKLDDKALTLAEILRNCGYDTAAFVSSFVLNKRFGLSQGFTTYDDVNEENDPRLVIHHMDGERTAEKTTAAAINWLQRKKQSPKPFFLWVHYYDPHSTYNPPQPFRQMYKDSPYDGEIAFTDSQIGRLFQALKGLNLIGNTLIVFAADHGEGLGEHKESGHAVFVYDTTIKVPLIFCRPGLVPEKKIIQNQVRLVDVMPTILDLLKMKKPRVLQGESFAKLLKGENPLLQFTAYAESMYARNHYNWSPLMTWRTAQWKYIHSSKPELYDIQKDPGELVNLATKRPDVAEKLDRELKDFLLKVGTADSKKGRMEVDDQTRQKLMSLGYLQGGDDSASKEPTPFEMIEVMEKMNLSVRQANQGMTEEAIKGLKEVVRLDPDNAEALLHLGQIHREIKRYDEAIAYFKKAASFKPDESKVHDGLGNIYKSMGRVEEAFQEFQTADKLDPGNPSILNNLGWYYQQKLQIDKALEYYDKALSIDDSIATAHANRAICYRLNGKLPAAIQELKKAIQLEPKLAFAYAELGACLAIQGNLDRAIRACQKAIQLDPKGLDGYNNLGVCFQRQGAHDKALASFLKAAELAPWNPLVYVNVGNAYAFLNKLEEARKYFKKALEMNPRNERALQMLKKIEKTI